jgi:hypothetical protein
MDDPKRPESHPTKECARARVRCLNTEPRYYCCPITLVCKLCQFNKKTRKQYGKLPLKTAEATPWEIVQVDLIGPWKVKTPGGVETLRCFTAIDPTYSWPEIVEITDKRSQTVMDAFHNNWLCCYPGPMQVTCDNGSEF